MRFSVSIPCFFKKDAFPEAISKVRRLGFDAAEIWGWDQLDLNEARSVCRENGVELLGMCTSQFCMTDPNRREKWLAGLRESCAAAQKAGVQRLITQVGPDTGAERSAQHKSIVAALRAAKPILEASGITLMVEPLNTLFDHPGYYLWSAVEGFEIIREADHPLVKLVYDIYHQQVMEGNIIPNITRNLDCIAHLHSAGHPGRHELQNGENDYKAIFAAVEKAGYTGACGLEYKPLLPPEESLRETKRIYG